MKLTQFERLVLANQYEILEKVDPKSAKHHEKRREIVERGYEALYEAELFRGIDDDVVSPQQGREVRDVLDMYRAITAAAKNLAEDSPLRESYYLKFQGFDGNDETLSFSFAQFLLEDMGHYKELVGQGDDGVNSHSPMMPTYRRMLAVHRTAAQPHKLTEAELQRILQAAEGRE